MKRVVVMIVALVVVAGVVGAVVLGSRNQRGAASEATSLIAPVSPEEVEAGDAILTQDVAARSTGGGSVGAVEPALLPAAAPDGAQPRVIRIADLSLIVAENGFDDAFDQASLVAKRYGGFVVDSTTEGTQAKAGSLTLRVPSDTFDEAMSDLRGLAEEIDREDVSGTDVTDQFVDLDARLRSWQAQERVLLKLMAKANSINDTMQVQNELQRVRYEIESIQGQLRVLRDQTSLATISVAMHERGAPVAKGEGDAKPSIVEAWEKAWAGALSVVSAVIVGLGYLLPLGAIALAAWFVIRRFRTWAAARPAA